MNGVLRIARVEDKRAQESAVGGPAKARAARADKSNAGHVGAPMPGTIVSLKKRVGDRVQVRYALTEVGTD